MDPDAALRKARVAAAELAVQLEKGLMIGEPADSPIRQLVTYFQALDSWLSSGGYKPQVWEDDD